MQVQQWMCTNIWAAAAVEKQELQLLQTVYHDTED